MGGHRPGRRRGGRPGRRGDGPGRLVAEGRPGLGGRSRRGGGPGRRRRRLRRGRRFRQRGRLRVGSRRVCGNIVRLDVVSSLGGRLEPDPTTLQLRDHVVRVRNGDDRSARAPIPLPLVGERFTQSVRCSAAGAAGPENHRRRLGGRGTGTRLSTVCLRLCQRMTSPRSGVFSTRNTHDLRMDRWPPMIHRRAPGTRPSGMAECRRPHAPSPRRPRMAPPCPKS